MTSKAVSPLGRVILPRPGEPLDVRKLYIEESTTNARRAHAASRTTLQIGAVTLERLHALASRHHRDVRVLPQLHKVLGIP